MTDVVRKLPEIEATRGNVRTELLEFFENEVPEYFWTVRASENHHPPDERELRGTWLHTKRVFTAYTTLEGSFRAMSRLSTYEANCARAAVLLHDAFKYGREPNDMTEDFHDYADGELAHLPEYTQPDHDTVMASYIRDETDFPEAVAQCVACHGGSNGWYGHEGPEPFDSKTLLVHLADVFASNRTSRIPVYDPDGLFADHICWSPEGSEDLADESSASISGALRILDGEWFEEIGDF